MGTKEAVMAAKTQPIKVPLSRPDITKKEIQSIVDVLRTPYLSLGPRLKMFEEKFAAYVGARYAVAVNSGTSGLHLAIRSLEIGEKDAVITTPFSFIASSNCIVYEKALPIFVDIEHRTFNIDPELIEEFLRKKCRRDRKSGVPIERRTGRVVKAILPVHVFGHPCEMKRIMELSREYGLHVIEDACESIGAEYGGAKVGIIGDVGIFAFYPNKQITTGEGGIIVTDDERIDTLCRSMRNQGRDTNGGWLAHTRLGYNYRISEINCALGIEQLRRIDGILRRREDVALRYNDLLRDVVTIPATLDDVKRSWFVYVICLSGRLQRGMRDEVLRELAGRGIGCSNYFPPIHLQPFYRETFGYGEGDFPVTEDVSRKTVALPFHNNLRKHEIGYVAEQLKEIVQRLNQQG